MDHLSLYVIKGLGMNNCINDTKNNNCKMPRGSIAFKMSYPDCFMIINDFTKGHSKGLLQIQPLLSFDISYFPFLNFSFSNLTPPLSPLSPLSLLSLSPPPLSLPPLSLLSPSPSLSLSFSYFLCPQEVVVQESVSPKSYWAV